MYNYIGCQVVLQEEIIMFVECAKMKGRSPYLRIAETYSIACPHLVSWEPWNALSTRRPFPKPVHLYFYIPKTTPFPCPLLYLSSSFLSNSGLQKSFISAEIHSRNFCCKTVDKLCAAWYNDVRQSESAVQIRKRSSVQPLLKSEFEVRWGLKKPVFMGFCPFDWFWLYRRH